MAALDGRTALVTGGARGQGRRQCRHRQQCADSDDVRQRWRTMLDVNLTGVFNTFRAVLPHLIERETGRLVATSSIVADTGAANSGHYAAAKAGVVALVKSLAHEIADHGITVNAVLPAGVNTPMMIHNPAAYRLVCPDVAECTGSA